MSVCLVLVGLVIGCQRPGMQERVETRLAEPGETWSVGTDLLDQTDAARDSWIGEDKLRHFGVAFAATTMTYGGARLALDPGPSRLVAATVGSILSVGKEVHDVRTGTHFSYRDLAWDAAGVTLGLALANATR